MKPFDSPSLTGFTSRWGRQCWEEAFAIEEYSNSYYDIVYSGFGFLYGNNFYKVTRHEARSDFKNE